MSWELKSNRKCLKCGYQFEQDEDTISIALRSNDKCPVCGGSSKEINKIGKKELYEVLGIKK
jgi:rubredoxin